MRRLRVSDSKRFLVHEDHPSVFNLDNGYLDDDDVRKGWPDWVLVLDDAARGYPPPGHPLSPPGMSDGLWSAGWD